MSEKKTCIVWTRPLCQLCKHVIKNLKSADIEFEERPVDGALWKFQQFLEVSPTWTNLPAIQLPDGSWIRNNDELEAWIGRDLSLYEPDVKPWAPR